MRSDCGENPLIPTSEGFRSLAFFGSLQNERANLSMKIVLQFLTFGQLFKRWPITHPAPFYPMKIAAGRRAAGDTALR